VKVVEEVSSRPTRLPDGGPHQGFVPGRRVEDGHEIAGQDAVEELKRPVGRQRAAKDSRVGHDAQELVYDDSPGQSSGFRSARSTRGRPIANVGKRLGFRRRGGVATASPRRSASWVTSESVRFCSTARRFSPPEQGIVDDQNRSRI
jgi:hypothetical protein